MMPRRATRSAVITLTSMICAAASSVISPAQPIRSRGGRQCRNGCGTNRPAPGSSHCLACRLTGAIRAARSAVGHQSRQLADQCQCILGDCPAMLASGVHLELQCRVSPPCQCRTILMTHLQTRARWRTQRRSLQLLQSHHRRRVVRLGPIQQQIVARRLDLLQLLQISSSRSSYAQPVPSVAR